MECIRNSLKIEQKGPEHLASLKTTVVNKLYAVQLQPSQPSTFSLRKALGTFSKMEDLSKDIENVPLPWCWYETTFTLLQAPGHRRGSRPGSPRDVRICERFHRSDLRSSTCRERQEVLDVYSGHIDFRDSSFY